MFPLNSYVETYFPNVMVLGVGPLEGDLVNGGGALMNGINALIQETPGSPPAPSAM